MADSERDKLIAYWLPRLGAVVILGLVLWFGIRGAMSWHADRQYDAALDEIVKLVPRSATNQATQKIDAVRTFVIDNSKPTMDEEFYSYFDKPHVMASTLLAYALGERTEPVHLECSRRAGLMSGILAKLGYKTRRIDIYDNEDVGRQHTFLEVLNPDTGAWETHDALYDIYWRLKSSGERIALTYYADDLDAIEPCSGNKCGWDVVSRENYAARNHRDHLDFMVVRYKSGPRYTVYSPRADPNKIQVHRSKRGTYCEVLKKNCRDGILSVAEHRQRKSNSGSSTSGLGEKG